MSVPVLPVMRDNEIKENHCFSQLRDGDHEMPVDRWNDITKSLITQAYVAS